MYILFYFYFCYTYITYYVKNVRAIIILFTDRQPAQIATVHRVLFSLTYLGLVICHDPCAAGGLFFRKRIFFFVSYTILPATF